MVDAVVVVVVCGGAAAVFVKQYNCFASLIFSSCNSVR